MDPGSPFSEVLAQHGCPDSVTEIDSETFTATWEKVKIVAFSPLSFRERTTVTYPIRRNKTGGPKVASGIDAGISAKGPLRSTGEKYGLVSLVAVIVAWEVGRKLRERARHGLFLMALVSVLLLASSWGRESSGPVGQAETNEASPVGELIHQLGPPETTLAIGDGQLLVYRTRETKHIIIGGSESVRTQAYLVQRGKVMKTTPRSATLVSQYYLYPFFETGESRLHALVAWSLALATIVLAIASRKKKAPAPTA